MQEFVQKIYPKGGIFQLTGTGSPEGVVIGYIGNHYLDTSSQNLYEKVLGDNTNTGWTLINGAGSGSITVTNNLTSSSTTDALSANQGRVLNLDSRFVVKRLRVLVGSSSGNKKGGTFNYGTTISDPFFSSEIFSGNNNDAFCCKITSRNSTSGYYEVYRADGSGWGDASLKLEILIFNGTY